MDDDQIQAFADALESAGDFTTPRTVIARRVPALLATRRSMPTSWLGEALDALVAHIRADELPPLGAALLQGPDWCRILDQGCCEQAAWFVERLSADARELAEPWVAVALPDPTASGLPMEHYEVMNLDRPVRITRLRWYAEMRSTTAAAAFAGTAELDGGSAAVDARAVLPRDAGFLGRVLRGHPARRRHRLRRGFAGAVTATMQR